MEGYTVAQVAVMSGLNPRTVREYLRRGVLTGEKTAEGWRFTPEQVAAFLNDAGVRGSVRAKLQGDVLDFLTQERRSAPALCVIADLPIADQEEEKALRQRLMEASGDLESLRYRFQRGMARVVLTGTPAAVKAALGGLEAE